MKSDQDDDFLDNGMEHRQQTTTLEQVRVAPGDSRLDQLRAIVTEKSMMQIDGYVVDLFSANTAVQIHDALQNPVNRATFLAFSVPRMMNIAFQLAAKCGKKGAS